MLKHFTAKVRNGIRAASAVVFSIARTCAISVAAIASVALFSDARAGFLEYLEESRSNYGPGAWFSPGIEQIELKDFCELRSSSRHSLEKCEDKGYGAKAVFGYNFTKFTALEGGYLYGWGWEKNFEPGSDTSGGNGGTIKRDLSTYWAGVSANFPLVNNWGIFGRYGYHWYDLMSKGESVVEYRRNRRNPNVPDTLVGTEYHGKDAYWGAGIEYRGEASTFKVGYVDYSMKSKTNSSGAVGDSALGTIKNPRGIELQWGWTFGGVSERSYGEFAGGVLGVGILVAALGGAYAGYKGAERQAERQAEQQQAERLQEQQRQEAERQQAERLQEQQRQEAERQAEQQQREVRQNIADARKGLVDRHRREQGALKGKHKGERKLAFQPGLEPSVEKVENLRKQQMGEWENLVSRQKEEWNNFVRQQGQNAGIASDSDYPQQLATASGSYASEIGGEFGEALDEARERAALRLKREKEKADILANNRRDPNQCASLSATHKYYSDGRIQYQDLTARNKCRRSVNVVYRTKGGWYTRMLVLGNDTKKKRVHATRWAGISAAWLWDGSTKCVEYSRADRNPNLSSQLVWQILSTVRCPFRDAP